MFSRSRQRARIAEHDRYDPVVDALIGCCPDGRDVEDHWRFCALDRCAPVAGVAPTGTGIVHWDLYGRPGAFAALRHRNDRHVVWTENVAKKNAPSGTEMAALYYASIVADIPTLFGIALIPSSSCIACAGRSGRADHRSPGTTSRHVANRRRRRRWRRGAWRWRAGQGWHDSKYRGLCQGPTRSSSRELEKAVRFGQAGS